MKQICILNILKYYIKQKFNLQNVPSYIKAG